MSPTEAIEGLFAVVTARQTRVKRVAYLSVHHLDEAIEVPHLASKLPIEQSLKSSGIPYTILRPNNFFQNDYWYEDSMMRLGIYPQPIGPIGLSRVDVADIAEAAAIVLTSDRHSGITYNLVGPDVLNGPDTAAAWERALGRPVAYCGDDLDAWEAMFRQFAPVWMTFDFRLMFGLFHEKGGLATADDLARQTALLGHPPRSFKEFCEETGARWT